MSILVTGANGGLGSGIAEYFLAQDPTSFVYLGVRNNRDRVDQLIAAYPDRCEAISLDVSNQKDWTAALESIEQDERSISVLVNNAGHHDDNLLATMPESSWHNVIDSNLNSAFYGSKAVIPGMMKARFGRIINIASLSSIMAPIGQTNYSAAKAGLVAMTRSLAKEVARAGITVNAISPGYIATDAISHLDKDSEKAIKKTIPARRFGTPEEVASAVFFLANPSAGYITGSNLKIDGGIF
ncbi:UNVERIFIED_CONTAM: hypothetical protein GTU68_001225 [Idotea baltica]|nr:hypothetical protein [Idotea baltica]